MLKISPVRLTRNTLIVLGVVVMHVALLWLIQTGLLRKAVEEIIPAEIMSMLLEPDAANPGSAPPAKAVRAESKGNRLERVERPSQQTAISAAELPVVKEGAVNVEPRPLTSAPPSPSLPATQPSNAIVAAPATPSAQPKLELPSSDAQYLQNPKPVYPGMSKRLGEQGKVVVRVLIGVEGKAEKVEIQQSSGFDRLDQAALSTVSSWRFVPGKRGGLPEAMWFNVPINFVLE